MSMQNYEPFRSEILTRHQLQALQQPSPKLVVRDTIIAWLIILTSWVCVASKPDWWLVAIAIPIIGTRYYALLIIAHDGLHRRLFSSKAANDLWNDLLILGPICAITRLNRKNHMQHHRELATATDPDRYKYISAARQSKIQFLISLTAISYIVHSIKNVFWHGDDRTNDCLRDSVSIPGYKLRDLAIIAGWQSILIGGLTYFVGWWGYAALWLFPVYIFAYAADMVRVFCEHSKMSADDKADKTIRLISFQSNILERQFFAPHNMNHHIAHHLWPSIPYYNLSRADEVVRNRSPLNAGLEWRSSYIKYLFNYWKWLSQKSKQAHRKDQK